MPLYIISYLTLHSMQWERCYNFPERELISTTVTCNKFSPGLPRETISFIHQEISMKTSAVVPQIWILLSLLSHFKRTSEYICVLKIVYREQNIVIFYSHVLAFLKCMWVLLWLIQYNFKNHAVFVIYFLSHYIFLCFEQF